MTRYEQGFLTKCAEYGLDTNTSVGLLKMSEEGKGGRTSGKIVGGGLGGLLGLGLGSQVRTGFHHVLYDPFPSKGLSRKLYDLGDRIRQSMIGKNLGSKYRKLMHSPKGKAIGAAMLALPLIGGAALGTAAGHGVDKLRE